MVEVTTRSSSLFNDFQKNKKCDLRQFSHKSNDKHDFAL